MTKKKPRSDNAKQLQLRQPDPKARVETSPPGTTKALPDLSCRPKKRQAKAKRPHLRQPPPAAPVTPVTTVNNVVAAPREMTRVPANSSPHPERQQAIEFRLFVAHPQRPLANGWMLLIEDRERAIESRHFAARKFVGRCGERWLIKIDARLARRLGLTGGVSVWEVLDPACENESAEKSALLHSSR